MLSITNGEETTFSVQNHQKFYCLRRRDENLLSIGRKASIFRHEHEKLTSARLYVAGWRGIGPPLQLLFSFRVAFLYGLLDVCVTLTAYRHDAPFHIRMRP